MATCEGCCQCEPRSGSIECLTELPVDNVLRDFLTANGLSIPADFAWTDDPKTTRALVTALVSDPAGAVRDAVCGGVGFGLIVRRARYYPRLSAIICPMQHSNFQIVKVLCYGYPTPLGLGSRASSPPPASQTKRRPQTSVHPKPGIELIALLQPVPHTASAAAQLQMVALGQSAEVLLQCVAAGSGQFDGVHHRDAPMLSGEFNDP